MSCTSIEKIHGDSCPDECNDALRDHGTVEKGTRHLFTLRATGHQRGLCRVEATDGATCYCYEKSWENRLLKAFAPQTVRQFGQGRPLHQQNDGQGNCHEKHGYGEQRIDFTYNFVNRKQRCDKIVRKYNSAPYINPRQIVAADLTENEGWTINEHGSHHHQQENGEDKHDLFRCLPQIEADNLRKSGTIVSNRQHAAHVVMDSPCKYTAKNNPQIGCGSELCTHDSSENRSCSSNVQELNHKHFPAGKHDVIDSVVHTDGWRHPVVRTKNTFNHLAVHHITDEQQNKA